MINVGLLSLAPGHCRNKISIGKYVRKASFLISQIKANVFVSARIAMIPGTPCSSRLIQKKNTSVQMLQTHIHTISVSRRVPAGVASVPLSKRLSCRIGSRVAAMVTAHTLARPIFKLCIVLSKTAKEWNGDTRSRETLESKQNQSWQRPHAATRPLKMNYSHPRNADKTLEWKWMKPQTNAINR